MTSHDVVSRVRRLAGTRKVGHAGTLDPMATGVLVLGRQPGHPAARPPDAGRQGVRRDDPARRRHHDRRRRGRGHRDECRPRGLDEAVVRSAAAEFVGDIEQVPTAVSAIKVDGKRAYQRVRDGEEVELKARPVTVHELAVHDVRGADLDVVDVVITVGCSSGTYIRAMARDLGAVLGVGGHLTALRRTEVGPYDLAAAHPLDELADAFTIIPIADAARAAFTDVDLDDARRDRRPVGRALELELPGLTAVFAPDAAAPPSTSPASGPLPRPSRSSWLQA